MLPFLLHLVTPSFAQTPPSLGLALASEHGDDGADLTLDIHNTALVASGPLTTATFLPLLVSWDFIEDASSTSGAIDRLELGILRTARSLEGDQLVVGFTLLEGLYDRDMRLLDGTALGSDVTVYLFEGIGSVNVGLDIRYRAQAIGSIIKGFTVVDHRAIIGIPLTLAGTSPDKFPWFANGAFTLRPNPIAYGEGGFFWDLKAKVAGGYTVLDGEDVNIRTQADFSWFKDGAAYPVHLGREGLQESFSEWTLAGGVALAF